MPLIKVYYNKFWLRILWLLFGEYCGKNPAQCNFLYWTLHNKCSETKEWNISNTYIPTLNVVGNEGKTNGLRFHQFEHNTLPLKIRQQRKIARFDKRNNLFFVFYFQLKLIGKWMRYCDPKQTPRYKFQSSLSVSLILSQAAPIVNITESELFRL